MRTVNMLFPVEGIMRELDFRLVLAVMYAEPRHRVFVGSAFNLFRLMTELDGGVFVGKSVAYPWPRDPLRPAAPEVGRLVSAVAAERGFPVVHLSEEGAIFPGAADSWEVGLDVQAMPSIFNEDTDVLTWGDWQRDYYRRRHPRLAERIVTTGHPRFDLYGARYADLYRPEADEIRRRHGRYVLVNTNFCLANHPQGQRHVFSKGEHYVADSDVERMRFVQTWSRIYRCMPAFVELVHALSIKRKDVTVIVRPHPSEDDELYQAAFAGIPNVRVLREGSVVPWIMSASIVVHDGCTTGLEAYLLGRPVLNYRPVPDEETDLYLPNLFGVMATTREAALEAILDELENPGRTEQRPPREAIPELAHSLFHNFRHEGFPLMVERMQLAEQRIRGTGRGASRGRVMVEETAALAIERAKSVVRPLFRERYLSAKHSRAAFPGFEKAWIADRLARVERILGKRVDFTYHSPSLLEIRAA